MGNKSSAEVNTAQAVHIVAIYGYSELDNPTPDRDAHPQHLEGIVWHDRNHATDYAKTLMPLHPRIHSLRVMADDQQVAVVLNPASRRRDPALDQKVRRA